MIRIAICEDNESDRQVIKRAVDQVMRDERKAYEVGLYADGEELLENYRIGVDILLLDIQMQSINGIAVAKKSGNLTKTFRSSLLPACRTMPATVIMLERSPFC